jgi:UDP-N-acetylmuramyl pentapeptide phosphotransferase/UDP-N-acetylglucosamine-1-phosphate transferase
MEFIYLLFIIPIFFLLIKICYVKNFLLDDKSLPHKSKFSKKKTPLLGGVLILISFLFIFEINNYYLLILFTGLFFLGLSADLNYLKSPFIRFFFQFLILFFFLVYFQFQLSSTKIVFLDYLLNYRILNIFFCIFCLMVLINGSNFIDGINTFLLTNYLIIFLILLLLPASLTIEHLILKQVIFVLFIIYILNAFELLYLGDNGSYFLSIFSGIFLIDFYNNNNLFISPFFIILLLWYPCFELLFTISRRLLKKKSSFYPDNLHLHYLFSTFFKNRFNLKKKNNDIFTSLIIGTYNFFIFYYSMNFISRTKNLIIIILINILLYYITYIVLNKLINTKKVLNKFKKIF